MSRSGRAQEARRGRSALPALVALSLCVGSLGVLGAAGLSAPRDSAARWGAAFSVGRSRRPEPEVELHEEVAAEPTSPARLTAGTAALLACALCWEAVRRRVGARARRALRRPYEIPDPYGGLRADSAKDSAKELSRIFSFIQETVLLPLDQRLPGRPFEYDFHSFPFTPMVLVIGNHSSGKSTFINNLLGKDLQETGVAPTDDGFTIVERHYMDQQEDGPTVLGCPENRPFAELRRFGQIFSGHLRRRRVSLPEESAVPFGFQIVDTPGMIDLPASTGSSARGRGYNFVDVVRWWAKRSDLILLLFDPDKPGTTGETLEVLTKSLEGLNHKFLIVLNKVDKLDNSVDFARAYGALGWALSKVIRWKDIPQIYTVYNKGFEGGGGNGAAAPKLPMEAFAKKREELIQEVLRVRERHNDNIITALEETLRQIEMVCTVIESTRSRVCRRRMLLQLGGLLSLGTPAAVVARLLSLEVIRLPNAWACFGIFMVYLLVCFGFAVFLREFYEQYQRLLRANIDTVFKECYARFFIHDDGEDLQYRWQVVSPKVNNIVASAESLTSLPKFETWEMSRIEQCLEKDMWYLRQIARQLREPASSVREGNNASERS